MSYLTFLAVAVVIAYTLFSRFTVLSSHEKQIAAQPEVKSETSEQAVPSPSSLNPTYNPQPTTHNSPLPTNAPQGSSSSKITINVDTKTSATQNASDTVLYPGLKQISGNQYQTSDSGEMVYTWYKQELEQKSYQIRNNVKTKANDQFKAVLQGVSQSSSIKISIDQASAGSVTIVTIE